MYLKCIFCEFNCGLHSLSDDVTSITLGYCEGPKPMSVYKTKKADTLQYLLLKKKVLNAFLTLLTDNCFYF